MWWSEQPVDSFGFDCLYRLEWLIRCFVCVIERQTRNLKPMVIQPVTVADALDLTGVKPLR